MSELNEEIIAETVAETPKRKGRTASEPQEVSPETPATDETLIEKEALAKEREAAGIPTAISTEMEEQAEAMAAAMPEDDEDDDVEETAVSDDETAHGKRGISKATRTQRRKRYGGEHIVGQESITEDLFNSMANERRKEKDMITDAIPIPGQSNGKILRGIITGAIPASANWHPQAIVQLKDSHGFFEIHIPAPFLYNYDINDPKFLGDEGKERLLQEISARTNSEIDFIPIYMDETNEIVHADRLRAMQQQGYYNYIYETRRTGRPIIEPNKKNKRIVAGMITKVMRFGIVVECKGAETFIPNEELSYNRIDRANDHPELFQVGKYISVRIMDVDKENIKRGTNTYTLVKITGSVKKAAEKTPTDMYWDKFQEGCLYSGKVMRSQDNEKGKKYWVTLQDKLDCICLPPSIGIPRVGQTVTVLVERKMEYPSDDGKSTVKQMQGKIKRLF